MRTPYTHPKRLPLVAASILSADFARMGDDCAAILAAGADSLHLDVMDGHFVPNLTMGPALCAAVRRACPDAYLDVHLMVIHPERFVAPFANAGASHITFHIEVTGADLARRIAGDIRDAGLTAGIALNPATPASAVAEALAAFDLALVMSVNPGFSGQAFIPAVLDKVREIEPMLTPVQRLQMDGGINDQTARQATDAGCDTLVAASAIFGQPPPQRPAAIARLRGDV